MTMFILIVVKRVFVAWRWCRSMVFSFCVSEYCAFVHVYWYKLLWIKSQRTTRIRREESKRLFDILSVIFPIHCIWANRSISFGSLCHWSSVDDNNEQMSLCKQHAQLWAKCTDWSGKWLDSYTACTSGSHLSTPISRNRNLISVRLILISN